MAIALRSLILLSQSPSSHEKYPGGWDQCLKDHKNLLCGRVWFDDHLLRDGAMNPRDIDSLVDEWKELGFEPTEERDGQRVWKDCCVVQSLFGGPTLACDWLEMGEDGCTAYLKGTEPGEVASRPGWSRPL